MVFESSSLVSVLFREEFSHPYISFVSFTSMVFVLYYNTLETNLPGAPTAPNPNLYRTLIKHHIHILVHTYINIIIIAHYRGNTAHC